jgi:hypothetical protein
MCGGLAKLFALCAISHTCGSLRAAMFRRVNEPGTPMRTAFHVLFSVAFVLGLASSVLANVH